eukprot:5784323-Amphidinium_carterae.1
MVALQHELQTNTSESTPQILPRYEANEPTGPSNTTFRNAVNSGHERTMQLPCHVCMHVACGPT